jgi:DNA-binding transcriptional regulator YdaS (Cro superfamily)
MDLRDFLRNEGLTQAQFAHQLGVSQGLVWQWLNRRTVITAERAIQIERLTAGKVSRAHLRPDLYATEPAGVTA